MAAIKRIKRGKQYEYQVIKDGVVIETYRDNGKSGVGSARDLAQAHARRLNGGWSLRGNQ